MNLLIKPASSLCNMKCEYCFYHDESTHRDVAFKGLMNEEIVENLIRKVFEAEQEYVLFAFQGGEPTLAGLDFFKNFVHKVNQYNILKIPVEYTLQTNGIVIDESWAHFLRENKFLIGLSFDGAYALHNKMRYDVKGQATYKQVLKTLKLFNQYGVEYNVLSVVTQQMADNIHEVYYELKKNGVKFMQFIPCLNPLDCEETLSYTLTNDKYYEFLVNLFDLWYKDFMNKEYYSVRYFDNLFYIYVGQSAEQCGMQGHCNIQFVVEGNGDVYPCDFYCLDKYLLGNIKAMSFEQLISTTTATNFINDSIGYSEECKKCEAFKLCQSGCRRYKDKNGKYIYCDAFKKFYPKLMERFPIIDEKLKNGFLQ